MKVSMPDLEFSRPLLVEKITTKGIEQTITATPDERRRLAERFGITEVAKFEATLLAQLTEAGQTVKVTGCWSADVVQQCVVTLEPLPAHLQQQVDVLYLSSSIALKADPSPSDETYEAIVDGIVDLGELVAQLMGASLDPYPRKPGATFVASAYSDELAPTNPFAKLKDIQRPKGS